MSFKHSWKIGAQKYLKNLRDASDEAITSMRLTDQASMQLNIDLNQTIVTDYRAYRLSDFHYGPKRRIAGKASHTKRDTNKFCREGITPPFEEVRFELAQIGFYLVDLHNPADPERQFGTHLYLFVRPVCDSNLFWHGYNITPSAHIPQICLSESLQKSPQSVVAQQFLQPKHIAKRIFEEEADCIKQRLRQYASVEVEKLKEFISKFSIGFDVPEQFLASCEESKKAMFALVEKFSNEIVEKCFDELQKDFVC